MNKYKILTLLFLLVSIGVESKAASILLTSEGQQAQLNAGLIEAAKQGDIQKVTDFVTLGANIDAQDNQGRTPLKWAIENKHPEVVVVLLNSWQEDLMLVTIQEFEEQNFKYIQQKLYEMHN